MNCDSEVWKDVSGYENLYEVANFGRVKSLGRFIRGNSSLQTKRWLKGRFLKTSLRGEYLSVQLHKNEVGVFFTVSRLVAFSTIKNVVNGATWKHVTGSPE